MNTIDIINNHISDHINTIKDIHKNNESKIEKISKILSSCLSNNGTIYWCGNGGSAADSQHLAAELVGRFKEDRPALRSVSLTTDSSVLTCIANDYSYDNIFSRQIEALGRKGDVLVAISTSGNSANIISALQTARKLKVDTISLLGKDGGKAADLSDTSLVIDSLSTARIQESHILIGHILCDLIERELGLV
jgi:D-sedoheptulose 7-phosphate isomerase